MSDAAPDTSAPSWIREEARRRGAAQRAAQGLPPTITDPVVIAACVKAIRAGAPTTATSPSLPPASAAAVPPAVAAAGEGDLGAAGPARGSAGPARSSSATTTKPRAATQGSVNNKRGRGRSTPAAHAGSKEQ